MMTLPGTVLVPSRDSPVTARHHPIINITSHPVILPFGGPEDLTPPPMGPGTNRVVTMVLWWMGPTPRHASAGPGVVPVVDVDGPRVRPHALWGGLRALVGTVGGATPAMPQPPDPPQPPVG